jgi:hypothetical protein
VGGLESPPAGRLRRAYLHLPHSTESRSSTYIKPLSSFGTHSHVPRESVATFWNTVADALLDGGRVVFVDEHVSAADHETWLAEHIVQRKPSDGSTYRIVKTFLDPQPVTDDLTELGWHADVHRLGTRWVLGTAMRM